MHHSTYSLPEGHKQLPQRIYVRQFHHTLPQSAVFGHDLCKCRPWTPHTNGRRVHRTPAPPNAPDTVRPVQRVRIVSTVSTVNTVATVIRIVAAQIQ